ncbi:MAG TPA: AbiH family protein [Paludibacter sp.]
MSNLVIIGNGFDLAHDLKTGYQHFIEYLIASNLESNRFEEMFSLGAGIANLDELKAAIKEDSGVIVHGNFKNEFLYLLISELSTNNWCDIETEYFKQIKSKNENSCYYNNPQKLNEDFNQIKECLAEYLKEEEKKAKAIDSYKNMFRLLFNFQTIMLNFNYTNTLEYLYSDEISHFSDEHYAISNEIQNSKIIHIHGELSNPEDNPIIFGHSADEVDSEELINRGNEYMYNIKETHYNINDNKQSLFENLDRIESIHVSILGHSFGLSDKQILKEILNHKNIGSITIFYHENKKNYIDLQLNMRKILGKNNIQNLEYFNNSHRMPQHNDSEEQQKAFVNYVEPICLARKDKKKQAFPERLRQENRDKIKVR